MASLSINHRRCQRCKTEKPTAEFYQSKVERDGFTKICRECNKEKLRINYPKYRERRVAYSRDYYQKTREQALIKRRDSYQSDPERFKEAQKKYHAANTEAIAARQKEKRIRYRNEVLAAYGGTCTCCGETDPCFLAVDHINNDGAMHRRQIGRGSMQIYRWLINNNFPMGFQLLCHNCNLAKAFYGSCPHSSRRGGLDD